MMKKQIVIFLEGRYNKKDNLLYRTLIYNKSTVAVDGGYRFFKMIKKNPDFLIGDFDSIRLPKNLSLNTEVITFDKRKDKTDGHLAIEYCVKTNPSKIIVVNPAIGQIDHLLGNLFLIQNKQISDWVKNGGELRMISSKFQMLALIDGQYSFTNCQGCPVSVIPMSNQITLTTSGMDYNVKNLTVKTGDTVSFRNKIVSSRAKIEIVGKAYIYQGLK